MNMMLYQKYANEAVQAFHRGNQRESATKYLQSYDISPDKWEENRWQIFHGYTSILQEEYFPANDADIDALKQIVDDKAELKLYRCEAAFTCGLLLRVKNQREEAADFYRKCVRLASRISEKERNKKVIASTSDDNSIESLRVGLKLIGEIVDGISELANSNLQRMLNPRANHPKLVDQQCRSDGTPIPPATRHTKIPCGTLSEKDFNRLISVGGERCDCCNKSRQEVGMKLLSVCSRCKMAYYCSTDCQAKQWKAGHKKFCRKPGTFQSGDYIRVNGLISRPDLNGMIVVISKEAPNSDDRWIVTIPGTDQSVSIASSKLEQLRPLK